MAPKTQRKAPSFDFKLKGRARDIKQLSDLLSSPWTDYTELVLRDQVKHNFRDISDKDASFVIESFRSHATSSKEFSRDTKVYLTGDFKPVPLANDPNACHFQILPEKQCQAGWRAAQGLSFTVEGSTSAIDEFNAHLLNANCGSEEEVNKAWKYMHVHMLHLNRELEEDEISNSVRLMHTIGGLKSGGTIKMSSTPHLWGQHTFKVMTSSSTDYQTAEEQAQDPLRRLAEAA